MKKTILKLLTGGLPDRASQLTENLTLERAIARIDRLFGCDRILAEFDADLTVPYYTQSELGYRLYHSVEDAIHMSLNFDGHFHAEGYYAQAKVVAEEIEKLGLSRVLELGCGKGFNSQFLADRFPKFQFVGIDLTPSHIAIANQKASHLSNLKFQIGDFNGLDFPPQSFDLAFAVECLCHAPQPRIVLAEIFRLLRPGGKLVIFDGYRRGTLESFPQDLQTATQLIEVAMAVQGGFSELEHWTEIAKTVGFSVESREDLSVAIQPTLLRLRSLSVNFFQSYWRSKLLAWLLPKYLIRNSVAGLLMPFAVEVERGSLGYYQLILKRK